MDRAEQKRRISAHGFDIALASLVPVGLESEDDIEFGVRFAASGDVARQVGDAPLVDGAVHECGVGQVVGAGDRRHVARRRCRRVLPERARPVRIDGMGMTVDPFHRVPFAVSFDVVRKRFSRNKENRLQSVRAVL